ncbi:MAG: NUDIX domain-containing protein [Chloroflexota bacterium]
MTERIARFCALCATPLEMRERFGRLRPVCPNCDHTVFFEPKVAVVAFVAQGDQLLLVKRLRDPGKGKWALPAGFVEADEGPRAAAERETLEETGMVVQVTRLLDLLHRPDVDGAADIVIAYEARCNGGLLCAADDAEDAAWFTRDHLPEIALTTTRLLVACWLDNKL